MQVNFLEERFYLPILGIYFEGFKPAAVNEVGFKMEGDRALMAVNDSEISDFDAVLYTAE